MTRTPGDASIRPGPCCSGSRSLPQWVTGPCCSGSRSMLQWVAGPCCSGSRVLVAVGHGDQLDRAWSSRPRHVATRVGRRSSARVEPGATVAQFCCGPTRGACAGFPVSGAGGEDRAPTILHWTPPQTSRPRTCSGKRHLSSHTKLPCPRAAPKLPRVLCRHRLTLLASRAQASPRTHPPAPGAALAQHGFDVTDITAP
jgi:hypothetical protein